MPIKKPVKNVIFFIIPIFFWTSLLSQVEKNNSNCPNIGFEDGTFNSWTGFTGTYTSIGTYAEVPGIVANRHEIMTGAATDPNTGGAVPVVAPGSIFSARLGNPQTGAEGDRLEYSMTISPENALLVYSFAVVLEDPSHTPSDQPTFDFEIRDQLGNIIDPTCGIYHVTAGGSIPGFESFGHIRYRDWTSVGIDLSPYNGQTVTISFQTRDCALGGHYGYAYIDARCGPLEILTEFCGGSNTITFTAPDGFDYLWSNGETTQSITIPSTDTVNVWTCLLTSVTGCEVQLTAVTEPTFLYPDFSFYSCSTANFNDLSTVTSGEIVSWEWDFGDPNSGSLNQSTEQNPIHIYTSSGYYDITLSVINDQGCSNTLTREVYIHVAPKTDFNWFSNCFEGDEVVEFLNLTTLGGTEDVVVYEWSFDAVMPAVNAIPETSTLENPTSVFGIDEFNTNQYLVTLIATLSNGCLDSISKVVDITPLPNLPDKFPNVFTPNDDGKNDKYYIENVEFMPISRIKIYNRWGQLVYESNSYKGDFNGTAQNGSNLLDGVYYYIFEWSDCEGVPTKIINGNFSVFR